MFLLQMSELFHFQMTSHAGLVPHVMILFPVTVQVWHFVTQWQESVLMVVTMMDLPLLYGMDLLVRWVSKNQFNMYITDF